MAFSDQKHASGLIGVVILGIVGSLIVRIFWAGGIENFFDPELALGNEVIEQLEAYPGNEVVFERLEEDFPDAYQDFTLTLSRAAQMEGPEDRVLIAGNNWINMFFASYAEDFKAAPLPALDNVMALEAQFLRDLKAHDEFACAFYARNEPQDQPLPESFDEASAEIVTARFDTILAGRRDQQLRLGITPSMYEAVEQTMRDKGLNDEQISVVFGEAEPGTIGAPLACEMAIELVDAIREQPDDARALLNGAYASGDR